MELVRRKKILHTLNAGMLIFSVILSFVRFRPVFLRFGQSLKDTVLSVGYCFTKPFGIKGVRPSVNGIPNGATEVLPFDGAEFKARLRVAWELFKSKANVRAFIYVVAVTIATVLPFLWTAVVTIVALRTAILFQSKKYVGEEKHNVDSKPLRLFKSFERKYLEPIKSALRRYVDFLKIYRAYWILFLVIWAYNLNFITIGIEIIAYVLYLIPSMDFVSLFTQIAKLAMDLQVAINFLPFWVWCIIGIVAFDLIRKYMGLKRLEKFEKHNRKFLDEHPGALYLTGKMRAKKTSIITDMALSFDQIFREKAKEGLLNRDKQFPYVAWQNIDLFYKQAMESGRLRTLYSCESFIRRLQLRFKYRERYDGTKLGEWMRYAQKKIYGYDYDNFIFDYDYERYGFEYDDGLTLVNVFDAMTAYLKQLWIYAAQTSLIFGNYAIRTDLKWKDKKHFPAFNGNFFKRKARDVVQDSGFCHIADMNYYRLGKLVEDKGSAIYNDGFEVGVVNVMEIGKEVGNQISNQGIEKGADESNAKNDGFTDRLKMQGHSSTIDNYTYFVPLFDDQRPDSLGADTRELCDVVMIKDASKVKVVMPGYFMEKALGWIAGLLYDKQHVNEKENRADNTLTGYLLKKLCTPIFNHIQRIKNTYSVYTANLRVSNEMLGEVISDKSKYYLCVKKIYSDRFKTDGIGSFFKRKASRSKYGLNDMPSFKKSRMNNEEMKAAHSHFYRRLDRYFEAQEAA